MVPVLVARGRMEEEPPALVESCWIMALRWVLSKEKPPSGRVASWPMEGFVNSDMMDVWWVG